MRHPTMLCLAAAMSLVLAGCNKPPEQSPAATSAAPAAAPAASTTIGTEIDDTLITTKVKSALVADPDINGFDLKVETRKGEVQLSGFVDNQAQIDRALVVARAVEGVSRVESGISIKEGTASLGNTVDDGLITTKVKSALLADADIRSFDIGVVTRKGEVQLSGFVNSQAQIDMAVGIARKVEGVTAVGNEMTVKN